MNKYILLSRSIGDIGGGQIYARNKINYMKKNNYVANLVFAHRNEIIIEDLKEYSNNYIQEFSICPTLLSKNKIKKTVEKFLEIVGIIDKNTIIEANSILLGLWAEIIAKEFNCLSYLYIISETADTKYKNFLEFKRSRKEIVGIKDEIYEKIFNSLPKTDRYDFYLPVVCSNVTENCKNKKLDSVELQDFNIASIGRLGKSYVPTLISEVVNFARANPNTNITFVIVGDVPDKSIKKDIINRLDSVINVKYYLVGSVYPIPIEFIKKMDVFVSAAGSANISARLGKPTISIDVNDFYSIGILNYNTTNIVFRKNEKKVKISDELSFLYKDNYYKKIKLKPHNVIIDNVDNIDQAFKEHLDYIEQIKKNNSLEYYDLINSKQATIKDFIKKLLILLFGIKIFLKIKDFIKKIR